jgi:protein-S-isoprenylcysteine O-methyltransferase Ste14
MDLAKRDWKWRNFPVPQPHLIVGGVGVILEVVWPLQVNWGGWWVTVLGITLVSVGTVLMFWATNSAGRVNLADPDRLVTNGPYSISRHPMYVAWTLAYLGAAAILTSAWLLILIPVLAAWVHVETGREERRMLEAFGSTYAAYRSQVRRYG